MDGDGFNDGIAVMDAGDGMPIGNQMTPHIGSHQVEFPDDEDAGPTPIFDDDAAATIVWNDFVTANAYLSQNSWLMEWQYIDFLYQSPTLDRNYRADSGRPARISRFTIAENKHTLSTQVRRGIFADTKFFVLEPRGKLAGLPNAQDYLDAWSELLSVLCDRADLEYNMELMIDCVVLQGTGLADPGWEERPLVVKGRRRKQQPASVTLPDGSTKQVNTWESDDFEEYSDTVMQSWPYFEYRRLGMTMYDPKWRTPNRPEMSAGFKVDIDSLTLEDLRFMRDLDCYKDIPDDEELKKFFLTYQHDDAEVLATTAQTMNQDSSSVQHAEGDYKNTSQNPFDQPFQRIKHSTPTAIKELLVYKGRKKIIRNETDHDMGDHALGYAATWMNIDNSGYGFGVGRMNAGDQRMAQGILNEVLKMIAYPMNAPLMYISSGGNAPTQDQVFGLGNLWGVQGDPGDDVRKKFSYLQAPEVPAMAMPLYELATQGGKDSVGANGQTMGGQASSTQGIGRSSFGAQRLATQADAAVSTPIQHLEYTLERFLRFLVQMVLRKMPIAEIRQILSDKFGETILKTIDADILLKDGLFDLKILAGQKLAARAAIAQLIPFLLQLVEQPQLLQYMHQKGWTINFKAIEDLFIQMSELQGRQDIIVRLTPEELAQVDKSNPETTRLQLAQMMETLKQQGKLQEIGAKGKVDLQNTIMEKVMEALSQHGLGGEGGTGEQKPAPTQLDLAENRGQRNTDLNILNTGIPSAI